MISLPSLPLRLAGTGCHTGMLNWDAVTGSIVGCCIGCHTGMPYRDVQLLPSLCSAQNQVAEGRGHSSLSCPTLKDRAGCPSLLLFPLLLAQLLVRDLWHNKGTADTEAQGTFGDQGAGEVLLPLQCALQCAQVYIVLLQIWGFGASRRTKQLCCKGPGWNSGSQRWRLGKKGKKRGFPPAQPLKSPFSCCCFPGEVAGLCC